MCRVTKSSQHTEKEQLHIKWHKSEPQWRKLRLNQYQMYQSNEDRKPINPIPEGSHRTDLYAHLNALFCGLWELKHWPLTDDALLSDTPPTLETSSDSRPDASLKYHRGFEGRQLFTHSTRTVLALFQFLYVFFKLLSCSSVLSYCRFDCSFLKLLDWSIMISLFSTDPEFVAWPQITTNRVVFRITHTAEGQHSCSWRTNWSMLGDRLPGH